MRTISYCGTVADGTGRGPTEAVNGRGAAAGFGGGKKFVEERFSGDGCEGEETSEIPGSRTGNLIRTVSCGFAPGSSGFVGSGTGKWMRTVSFFGWSGSAISVGEIDWKSPTCHYLMSKA